MPNGGTSEYRRLVGQARNSALTDLPQQAQQALADTYARQLNEVVEEMASLERGAGAQRVERLADDLARALNEYAARANVRIEGLSEDAVRIATDAHRNGLTAVNEASGANLSASFGRVPERAMESLYTRRGLDVVESFKTLNRFSAQADAQAIGDAIADAIGKGQTPRTATEQVARGLVQGDEQLEAAMQRFGPRGGLRAGQAGPVNQAAAQKAREIGFNARRIAITEIQAAYHEADVWNYHESPVTKGVRWTLSASHPQVDECDGLAEADMHGMGAGVFPSDAVPMKPHPFCICSLSPVFRDASEWDQPKPPAEKPTAVSEDEVADLLDDPTENEVERVMDQINTSAQEAYEFSIGND